MTKEYDMEALRVALDAAEAALREAARHEQPEWMHGRMAHLRAEVRGFRAVAWPPDEAPEKKEAAK